MIFAIAFPYNLQVLLASKNGIGNHDKVNLSSHKLTSLRILSKTRSMSSFPTV